MEIKEEDVIKEEPLEKNEQKVKKTKGRIATGVYCSVALCRNSGGKARFEGKNISFHRFPKDPKIRKQWALKCKRDSEVSFISGSICSEHFGPDDYERDFKSELLGLRKRNILKKGAIPSLKLPFTRKETKAALARKKRYEEKHQKDLMKQYLESALSEYEARIASFPEVGTQTLDDAGQPESNDQEIMISSVFSMNENYPQNIVENPSKTTIENTQNVEKPLDYEVLFNELLEKHIILEDKLVQQNLQRKAFVIMNKTLKRKSLQINAYREKLKKLKNEIKELKRLTKGNTRAKRTKQIHIEQIQSDDNDDNDDHDDNDDFSFVVSEADIEIY